MGGNGHASTTNTTCERAQLGSVSKPLQSVARTKAFSLLKAKNRRLFSRARGQCHLHEVGHEVWPRLRESVVFDGVATPRAAASIRVLHGRREWFESRHQD